MKAPDKIYVPQHNIEAGSIQELDELIVAGSTEYIRKDALIEWLNEKLQESAERLDFHANQTYAEMIDKLNLL